MKIERVEMLVTLQTEEGVFLRGTVYQGDKIPASVISEVKRGSSAVWATFKLEELSVKPPDAEKPADLKVSEQSEAPLNSQVGETDQPGDADSAEDDADSSSSDDTELSEGEAGNGSTDEATDLESPLNDAQAPLSGAGDEKAPARALNRRNSAAAKAATKKKK